MVLGVGSFENSDHTTLNNTLVTANQVTEGGYGSGVYIFDAFPEMTHTTLATNTGGDGSGVFTISSTVTLTNTILVSHTVGVNAMQDSSIALDHTLWGEGAWANGLDYGGNGDIQHVNDIGGDPGFAAPQSGDYHLLPAHRLSIRGVKRL